jgi:hypothetical protein
MELLGSIQRKELKRALEDQFTARRRLEYIADHTTMPQPTEKQSGRPASTASGEVIDTKDILVHPLGCT